MNLFEFWDTLLVLAHIPETHLGDVNFPRVERCPLRCGIAPSHHYDTPEISRYQQR